MPETARQFIDRQLSPVGAVLHQNGMAHVLVGCVPSQGVLHVVSDVEPRERASILRSMSRLLAEEAAAMDAKPMGRIIMDGGV